MIAPFLDPDLVWDFRLPRVASINTSGHKYGLVYPGVGWALWRDKASLPEELIFNVNYLGGEMPTFALNFSRPGAEVVAQYYTFFRLGRAGFRAVQQAARDVATYLADQVEATGEFRLISRGDELPVFAFTTADSVQGWDVFAVSRKLRERGWQVPAYTFPENREDLAVLRDRLPQRLLPRPGRHAAGQPACRGRRTEDRDRGGGAQRAVGVPALSTPGPGGRSSSSGPRGRSAHRRSTSPSPRPTGSRIVALGAGGGDVAMLCEQAVRLRVGVVGIARADSAQELNERLAAAWPADVPQPRIVVGAAAATELAALPCDVVLNAVAGAQGLRATLAALDAGRTVALANKESLVAGGPLVTSRARPGQIVPGRLRALRAGPVPARRVVRGGGQARPDRERRAVPRPAARLSCER